MDNAVLSYENNRRMVGILGIALPILLLIFAPLSESISACYWTTGRDLMVGVLCSTGIFLSMYRGYDKLDSIVSKIAGISMFFIGLFPVENPLGGDVSFLNIPGLPSSVIHTIFSVIFFILMGYMSIFLFTKTDKGKTAQKKKRNTLYIISGIIIWALILIMGIMRFIIKDQGSFVFFAESAMLFCFGASWLVKGRTLFKDK
jgi:hypothetical protein